MKIHVCYALIALSITTSTALAAPWNLPAALDDSNTKITFEVDSTWHLVEGATSGITGKAWLADPTDVNSIRATLAIPVARFDTDSSRRDSRLREVMRSEQNPTVDFSIEKATTGCTEDELAASKECPVQLEGKLSMSGTSRSVSVSGTVSHREGGLIITGTHTLLWADYGIEDPSIFIAKLDPMVKISFQVTLPDQNHTSTP